MIVGRLAPSPTGAQHLGNARTFLLAWLSVRHQCGRIVLRIEDIDSPRVKPWAMQQAIDDLRWLGLDWDEGPDICGPHGPYVQTERVANYHRAIETLVAGNRVYPCTCTRNDIDSAASAPHESIDGPIYSGRCSAWQNGDALPTPGTFCWRFRSSSNPTRITDLIHGELSLDVALSLGDFPVTRKSLDAAYQLAVVSDDSDMGITEVVRGDDLLPSAFRQAELMAALGLLPPVYAHVPLVVGADGKRLAKRHGDTRLSQYREQGIKRQQIIGWAAWSAGLCEANEPIEAAELVARFDWQTVSRKQVIVNDWALSYM